MAGYSGTPLPKKLGIKEEARVVVVGAPDGFPQTLGDLPEGAVLASSVASSTGHGNFDVAVLFVTRRADFVRQLAGLRRRMKPAAGLWIAWPKKASKVSTDMTEDVVREVALPTGLVDNKVCAIDEVWSGLRLVIRLEHRG